MSMRDDNLGGTGSTGGGGLSGSAGGGSGSMGEGGLSGSGSTSGGMSGSGSAGSTSGGGMSGLSGVGGGTLGGSTGSGSTTGSGLSGSTSGSTLSDSGPGTMGGGSSSSTAGSTAGSTLSGSTGSTGTDDFDQYDTSYYSRHHTAYFPERASTGGGYDQARSGYALGHRAASNPSYAGRTYEEVEVDLRREYGGEEKASTFENVRDYVRHGFEWKTVLGGIAVAAGGWWAGNKLYDVWSQMGTEEDQDCRTYYEAHPARTTVSYDQARTGYTLGYTAARNADYTGRTFEDVEPHLRGGYTGSRAGSYDALRDFTRRGYERGSTGGAFGGSGG
jgi:hypothetical protein